MDQERLVDKDREIGRKVAETLSLGGVPVRVSFWKFTPQLGEWQFFVATPRANQGPKHAYSKIVSALQKAEFSEELPMRRVFVVGPRHPIVTLCLAILVAFVIEFCPSNIAAQNVHQNIELPKPTGPYQIGRVSYDWVDEHRSDPSRDGAKREIMVDIWYPADVPAGAATAPLLPGTSRLTGIPEQIMRDEQFKQAWPAVRSGAITSHAVANAPVTKKLKRFAVLIFSPGLGSATYAYTSQLEDLASHGYFVAAIEHTYDTPAVIFPDGRIVPFDRDLWSRNPEPATPGAKGEILHKQRTVLWADDISFVLNGLVSLNGKQHNPFYRRIDLDHVGAFGHSSGGRAAARACQLDRRIKACLSEDGNWFWEPFWLDDHGKSMEQPFNA